MVRKLRSVEQLGSAETATILKLPGFGEIGVADAPDEDDLAEKLRDGQVLLVQSADDAS